MLLRHNCTTASWITYCGVIVNQDIDIQAQLIQCAQWFVRNDELHAYVDGRLYIIGTDSIIELLRNGTREPRSTLHSYGTYPSVQRICWNITGEDAYGCFVETAAASVFMAISFSNEGWHDETTKIDDTDYARFYDRGKYWHITIYTAQERMLRSNVGNEIVISYQDCGVIRDIRDGLCLCVKYPGSNNRTTAIAIYCIATRTIIWLRETDRSPGMLRFVADNVVCATDCDENHLVMFINIIDNTTYML